MKQDINNALLEMLDVVEKDERKKEYEIIKIYNSRKVNYGYRIDLIIAHWKTSNKKVLECRKFFFKKKYNEWVMGGHTGISEVEINVIADNIEDIKKQTLSPVIVAAA